MQKTVIEDLYLMFPSGTFRVLNNGKHLDEHILKEILREIYDDTSEVKINIPKSLLLAAKVCWLWLLLERLNANFLFIFLKLNTRSILLSSIPHNIEKENNCSIYVKITSINLF